jgi:hypothetical protein
MNMTLVKTLLQNRTLLCIALITLGVGVVIALCVFNTDQQQESAVTMLSNNQQQLLTAVYAKVNTANNGMWDKELEIKGVHALGDAAFGTWTKKDVWNWIAWREVQGEWNVLVSLDGFDSEALVAVPKEYDNFFAGVTGFSVVREETKNEANQYWNEEARFGLVIPEVWKRIGYSVERDVYKDGTLSFRFILKYKNEDGTLSNFTTGSLIRAVPIEIYTETDSCAQQELCVPGKKIGLNNTYVFVSEEFSPEAYGDCVDRTSNLGHTFYDLNKDLCDNGPAANQPERIQGNFRIK